LLGAGLALAVVGPSSVAHAAANGAEKLQEFPQDQVQITDAYQQNLFKKEMAYLLTAIDSDRLMAGFKAVSQNVTPPTCTAVGRARTSAGIRWVIGSRRWRALTSRPRGEPTPR